MGETGPGALDPEQERKARLLVPVLRALTLVCVLACALSLADRNNDLRVSVGIYSFAFVVTLGLASLARRGHVVPVAWATSLFVWALTAALLPFFGGMRGHNGSLLAVGIVLIGTLVGSAPAFWLAVVSVAYCGVIAFLELHDRLPPQLGPYSPINAWTAVSATLLLTTVLVQATVRSLLDLMSKAAASARERDEVLRRSIAAQKMELVGNLASGIAHDFNNLLSVITGSATYLRHVVPASAETSETLDDLDAATVRATLITRQLLSLAGTRAPASSATDLAEVTSTLGTLLPRLMGARIRVVVDAPAPTFVTATRVGLEQVVLNLAVNARDAMPDGGTFRMSVRQDDAGRVGVLTVADTGTGMDAETRARAFESFFTTKKAGTGLGLAMVQTIVSRLDGTITLESTPGKGTTFELRLPLASDAPEGTEARISEIAITTSGRALLVEDDPMGRRATQRTLETLGLDVVAVSNGLEALRLVEISDFDVVVSDMTMPQLEGDELARRLATSRPALPVVLTSGKRRPDADVLAAPRRAFVAKPATRDELARAIREARATEPPPAPQAAS